MFLIIMYHLVFFFIAPTHPEIPFWKIIQIPLHTGVICFILISGYFIIKISLRGFIWLLLVVAFFYIPSNWINLLLDHQGSIKYYLSSFLFITRGPYWFVNTYILLYLLSPMINFFIRQDNHLVYLLVITGFVTIYAGLLSDDPALSSGKNLLNFIFIYSIGQAIKRFDIGNNTTVARIFLILFLFYGVLFILGYALYNTSVFETIWSFSFPYGSPFLIINGTLIFLLFTKICIRSTVINYVASSCLSMYVVHFSPLVMNKVLKPICYIIDSRCINGIIVFVAMVGVTFIIMILSLFLFKVLEPFMRKLHNLLTISVDNSKIFYFYKKKVGAILGS